MPARVQEKAMEKSDVLKLDREFTSTVPWEDTDADCVVICCSDPRFEQQNEELVNSLGFSQPHFIQIPAGLAVFTSLVAAASFLHKGMGLLLKKAIERTGAETVIGIGHEDCGGYQAGKHQVVQAVARRLSGKPVREIQLDHLKKAGRTISRQLGDEVDVRVFYADVVKQADGDRVKFSAVDWGRGRG
jgi:carbonic anhydrase